MHADPSRPLTPAARPTPTRPGGSAGGRPPHGEPIGPARELREYTRECRPVSSGE